MTNPTAAPQGIPGMIGRPVRILLVEDSPSDVALTITALESGRVANEIAVVVDGEEALAYLHREGEYSNATRPDLILLDLNMPKKDGREVLAEVKSDPDLKAIPIIVLTTSAAESDILRSYELQANSYVTKPVGLDPFLAAVRGIEDFWLTLVRLPDGQQG
jgi:chemotaxis family two-component system response regulator Rcp1